MCKVIYKEASLVSNESWLPCLPNLLYCAPTHLSGCVFLYRPQIFYLQFRNLKISKHRMFFHNLFGGKTWSNWYEAVYVSCLSLCMNICMFNVEILLCLITKCCPEPIRYIFNIYYMNYIFFLKSETSVFQNISDPKSFW